MSSSFKRTVAALALAGLTVAGQPVAHAQTAPITFNIAGITDFHGHLEKKIDSTKPENSEPGIEALTCMLPIAAEGKEQLFVSSGDNIGGSAFTSALLDDEPTIKALNTAGLKASAVGNHDFDKGYADLSGRVDGLANFPYLGANVNGENPELAPYKIETVSGVKVALVGTVTQTTKDKVSPEGIAGISFDDPWAVTNATAEKLKKSGEADVVVALIHEGFSTPEKFNSYVDIAMGGDSHLVENQVVTRADGSKFALVQAGHYGRNLADLDITFDPGSKKITDLKSTMYDATGILNSCGNTPVPAVGAIVAEASAQAKVKGDAVVANISNDFYRAANADGKSGGNRGTESTLSNLIAEAQKQYIAGHTTVKPDLGVMNPGGVRADLAKGDVTYADAFAVQPFGNELTYGTYTGAELKKILEQQWKDSDPTLKPERPVLQLGWSDNFTYTFDASRPYGDRIISMQIDGKEVSLTDSYVIAGSTFLLKGGDSFDAFNNAASFPNTGIIDVDAFIDFLKTNPKVAPRTGQSAVGVHVDGKLAAGQKVKVDLSSLIYTIGDTASSVTVKVGEKTVTATIDKTLVDGLPTAGTASVEIELPATGTNPVNLEVTTDAGTKVSVPLIVENLATATTTPTTMPTVPAPTPGQTPEPVGSSKGGNLLTILGVFGAIGLVLHTIAQFNSNITIAILNLLPATLRAQLQTHIGK